MGKALTIYKASAGSGKTFTLATEYIKLLLHNPQNYKHILAVTFTNKATEEMKLRIVSQLYGLSRNLPESRSYMEVICRDTGLNESEVAGRAETALHDVLHNYGWFRIETIDKFFQHVLRGLSRELDLPATMQVVIDDGTIAQLAVDTILDEIETDTPFWKYLMSYIGDSIDNDEGWNVIKRIKDFAQQLFKDFYRAHGGKIEQRILDDSFFDSFTAQLGDITRSLRTRMQARAKQFFTLLEKEGIDPDDLAQKNRGVAGYFKKLQEGQIDCEVNKYVEAALECPEEWFAKTKRSPERVASVRDGGLWQLLIETVEEHKRDLPMYLSVGETRKNLPKLRLLRGIELKLRQLCQEAGSFMLSDTPHLLASLIEGQDTPFVFERIGTQVDHIMIDEFQDTSLAQWENFKRLLDDTMSRSEKGGNLIVGDVKQSIYRWRNSNWKLLSQIDKEFADKQALLEQCRLGTNFRSARKIVGFNNCFFEAARDLSVNQALQQNETLKAQQLKEAYSDVAQQVPPELPDEGYVEINLLHKDSYSSEMFPLIESHIDRLLAMGVEPQNIAILVRNKQEHIPMIASWFEQNRPDLPIVSDEAFRLGSSRAVMAIIKAMQLGLNPEDKLLRAEVAALSRNATEPTGRLRGISLIEVAMNLYRELGLDKSEDDQSAYVSALFDKINEFENDTGSGLREFLDYWNEHLCNEPIPAAEISAIRVITIHKCKGLEWENVIVPFCNWDTNKGDVLWCIPRQEPLSKLPVIPVNYKASLKKTLFADEYREEEANLAVDNLNLLYVAFTRARRRLYVIGKRDATEHKRSLLIEQVLPSVADQLPGALLDEGDAEAGEPIVFKYGEAAAPKRPEKKETKEVETSRNVFTTPRELQQIRIECYDGAQDFRQSNKSRDFVAGETDGEDEERSRYIKLGNLLHNVFARLRTLDDIEPTICELEQEGVLGRDNGAITKDDLRAVINKAMSQKQARDWFSNGWTLFNECSIVYMDNEGHVQTRRPDRVMQRGEHMEVVDFKFGKRMLQEHRLQVGQYMELLKQMGYTQVSGWLWYVTLNKIEKV